MKPLPPSIEETLVGAERKQVLAMKGWHAPGPDMLDHTWIRLLLPGNVVVLGWARRLQPRWPVTCWTWDYRFRTRLPGGGVRPGLVNPIAWCPDDDAGAILHIPTVAEYEGDVTTPAAA